MARSRSSFDLDGAVLTAAGLVKQPKPRKRQAPSIAPAGAPLVSFDSRPPPTARADVEPVSAAPLSPSFEELAPSSDLSPMSSVGAGGELGLRSALPPSADDGDARQALDLPSPASSASFAAAREPLADRLDVAVEALAAGRAAPRFPDLAAAGGPVARCEKVIEWIAEATGAADVFLADAAGLPFAGAIRDTEARLAASGLIASAIGSLVAALPGAPSQRFELCVGDGPFFQLIGFQVRSAAYIVGLMRPVPLMPREAHAVRIACRHALDAAVGVVG
ncbi:MULTISPECIES: hypothetical protein [Sorangium]|uniref:Uncharacterized protein n=1 Tax=Sorangium cellulosum TaxID=56 RepID=A0A4P2R0C7_SORCE|nr:MULTISPECIES: hypothetical protein [Sorangium]AUX36360.1 hypothetical protein SOCE836_085670 [Sorangium cellulosum]WCQ95659.1 hypothetical protein NQZ70_08436 [Sorangium sp. Soce836]